MLDSCPEVFESQLQLSKQPPLPTLTWFRVTAGSGAGVCCCTAAAGGAAVVELVALRGSFLGAVFPLTGLLRGLRGFWWSWGGGGSSSLSLTAGLVGENRGNTDKQTNKIFASARSVCKCRKEKQLNKVMKTACNHLKMFEIEDE